MIALRASSSECKPSSHHASHVTLSLASLAIVLVAQTIFWTFHLCIGANEQVLSALAVPRK
jgi:hypothetical protein